METASVPAINLAIVGVGKIVRDQHLPAVAGDAGYRLVAAASRHGKVDGIDNFTSIDEMLSAVPAIQAVSLCMPPQYRYEAAAKALAAGKHVFLEKPPGATLSEVEDLASMAAARGLTLFASWHSRYAPAVEAARGFLAGTRIGSMRVAWKEDVRQWHPNQEWIWRAGGLGVFDPGINALSIVTRILPRAVFATAATLEFPGNREAPIAASVTFTDAQGLGFYPDSADTSTKPHTGEKECLCPSASVTARSTSTSWLSWSAVRSPAAARSPWRSGSTRPC